MCHLSPFNLSKVRLLLLRLRYTYDDDDDTCCDRISQGFELGENLLMALCVGLHITALMDELFFRSGFKLIIVG